jgi:hypothetical protein
LKKFDVNQPLEVLKSFKLSGKLLESGTPFNWKRYGLTPRRVQQLFENRFLKYGKLKLIGEGKYKIEVLSRGWVNVVDTDSGERVNESSLRYNDAQAFIASLSSVKRARKRSRI